MARRPGMKTRLPAVMRASHMGIRVGSEGRRVKGVRGSGMLVGDGVAYGDGHPTGVLDLFPGKGAADQDRLVADVFLAEISDVISEGAAEASHFEGAAAAGAYQLRRFAVLVDDDSAARRVVDRDCLVFLARDQAQREDSEDCGKNDAHGLRPGSLPALPLPRTPSRPSSCR